MIAAGVLTGPLGLGAVLDAQAAIYLLTGLVAVRALESTVRTRRGRPARRGSPDKGRIERYIEDKYS